jgi:hypothetical protein
MNIGKFDIPSRNSKTNSSQNRTEFGAKVNLNKDKCIKVIPPLMEGVQF